MGASFLNAVSANLLDFDDTHLDTIIHPAAPVAAPVLALAQARGFSGRAVLTAFILGVEIECRVGNAVSPGHYARGWHITSTCGVFGAAAACAKLLELSADQIANAIGIAASQSAGIVENLPSAAKNVSVGNAARNGLFAALLAAEGYSASPRAIEGPLGWARAMGDEPDMARLTGGLGKTWEIAKNTYKPYPAGIVFHAVIDACFNLRAKLTDASTISRPSRCRVRRCCWRAATGWFATNAMRGSAFIIARPARCCWARPAFPNSRTRPYFGPTSCRCARR